MTDTERERINAICEVAGVAEIDDLIWMFFGVAFFSLGLLVGYGMCEDKQNRRKDGENHDESSHFERTGLS